MTLPTQMRAIEISTPGGPEVLKPAERPVPQPKPNEILIKVCQNEQEDTWAQLWSFQLRVTDHLGGKVPLRVVTAVKGE